MCGHINSFSRPGPNLHIARLKARRSNRWTVVKCFCETNVKCGPVTAPYMPLPQCGTAHRSPAQPARTALLRERLNDMQAQRSCKIVQGAGFGQGKPTILYVTCKFRVRMDQ